MRINPTLSCLRTLNTIFFLINFFILCGKVWRLIDFFSPVSISQAVNGGFLAHSLSQSRGVLFLSLLSPFNYSVLISNVVNTDTTHLNKKLFGVLNFYEYKEILRLKTLGTAGPVVESIGFGVSWPCSSIYQLWDIVVKVIFLDLKVLS